MIYVNCCQIFNSNGYRSGRARQASMNSVDLWPGFGFLHSSNDQMRAGFGQIKEDKALGQMDKYKWRHWGW